MLLPITSVPISFQADAFLKICIIPDNKICIKIQSSSKDFLKLNAACIKLRVVISKSYFCQTGYLTQRNRKFSKQLFRKINKNTPFKMQQTRLDKLLTFFNDEPGDEFLKYALATEYLRLNDTTKALEFYEDLINNHPAYVGTYYHLGKLYEALNRKTDAVFTYEKGMDIAQKANDMHAFSELQGVYRELTNYKDEYEDD